MQLIQLKNFKSYDNQLVNNLNPKINVFIGSNGQGKSNFFKAISFALTDKVHLNRNEYQAHLHRAIDTASQPLAVEIYLRSKMNQRQYDQNIYKVERIWTGEQQEELKVEDKLFSKADYESFIESLGFSYSNAYNILHQGQINQVVLMDQFDIYKLLEEATSIKKCERRHQQAINFMRQNHQQKQEIQNILKEIKTRLEVYQSRREEFELYSFEQKASKVKNKAEYEEMIKKFTKEIKELEQKEGNSSGQCTSLKLKIKQVQSKLEQLQESISVNQKQIYQHFDESTHDETLELWEGGSQEEKRLGERLKQLRLAKEKKMKELKRAASETQKIQEEMKPYKEKYESMTSLISAGRLLADGKNTDQLKGWIQKTKNNLKEISSELTKVGKMKSEFKIKEGPIDLTELQTKKEKLLELNNELKTNKLKYFETSRLKNQYEAETDVFAKQIEINYNKMKKALPLLEFNLLNQLRKEKVPGVYGFLIEFVDILPTVLFAFELSGLSKLCTLLVEDEAACEAVVNMNKKIKGKQINILPLSLVKRQPTLKKSVPNIEDCYSLLNQNLIKIRPHSYGQQFSKTIQKIIVNTFSSHFLVTDYDTGLKVSKEFHLNCITADKEIVYSEGYLCKVGKDMNVDDRLELYYKYAQKSNQMEEISKKLAIETDNATSLQNKQMEIIKKKAILQSQVRNLEANLGYINEQKRALGRLDEEETRLLEKKKKYESEVANKEEVLANLEKKISTKIDMKEYASLEETYQHKLKAYHQQSEEECLLENAIAAICKQEEELSDKIKEVSFSRDLNQSFVGAKMFKKKLQEENQHLQSQKKKIQSELLSLEEKLAHSQTQNYNCLGNLSILQDQVQFYKEKLSQIGALDLTMEEVEQKSNSFSLSISRMDERRKVRVYTTVEKLMFSKIEGYLQKYKEAQTKYKELEQVQKEINTMIQKFEEEKERSLNSIFSNFQQNFEQIFRAITLTGKTDVRLKKINQTVRGFLKVRKSISILVSFQSEREVTRKWTEFSGGQKTVIALCLLMALQKCQPAPLYIFDEVDSALDSIYLDRIVKLIQEESEHSQYFISSFKRAMLQFGDEKCNYYVVQNHQRVSKVRRVAQEQAEEAIGRIIDA